MPAERSQLLGIPVVWRPALLLVPIIVAVWFQSHLQRWLTRLASLIHVKRLQFRCSVLLIMVPLTLIYRPR